MFLYTQSGNCFFLPNPNPTPLVELLLKQVSIQYEGSPEYLGPLVNLGPLGIEYATIVF